MVRVNAAATSVGACFFLQHNKFQVFKEKIDDKEKAINEKKDKNGGCMNE